MLRCCGTGRAFSPPGGWQAVCAACPRGAASGGDVYSHARESWGVRAGFKACPSLEIVSGTASAARLHLGVENVRVPYKGRKADRRRGLLCFVAYAQRPWLAQVETLGCKRQSRALIQNVYIKTHQLWLVCSPVTRILGEVGFILCSLLFLVYMV